MLVWDARLKLLYFIALAASLLLAGSVLRVGIVALVLGVVIVACRKRCLRRWYSLVPVSVVAGSVFLLHCLLPVDQASDHDGCALGARLALTILSIWAGATLLFGGVRPRELVTALGSFLPLSRSRGSFTNSLVSMLSTGLLILPVCTNSLRSARTAMKARGGSLRFGASTCGRQNVGRLMAFALRRLYLASDEIVGRLSVRGYSGAGSLAAHRAAPIGIKQVLSFIGAAGLTVGLVLL